MFIIHLRSRFCATKNVFASRNDPLQPLLVLLSVIFVSFAAFNRSLPLVRFLRSKALIKTKSSHKYAFYCPAKTRRATRKWREIESKIQAERTRRLKLFQKVLDSIGFSSSLLPPAIVRNRKTKCASEGITTSNDEVCLQMNERREDIRAPPSIMHLQSSTMNRLGTLKVLSACSLTSAKSYSPRSTFHID
jgi:hypothetical protein